MKPASAAAAGSPSSLVSPTPVPAGSQTLSPVSVGDFQIKLISALMAQTEALNRQAASIQALSTQVGLLIAAVADDGQVEGIAGPQFMDQL